MSTTRVLCAAGVLLAIVSPCRADPEPTVAALRDAVVRAADRSEAYAAYKAYFQRLGPAGIRASTTDTDTGIALQAAWEAHKKPAKRPRPVPGREDEVFDPAELAKFVAFLTDRTKAPVPDWWARVVVDVDLVLGKYHVFPAVRPEHGAVGPNLRRSKAGNLVPRGAELERDGERLVYTAGGRLVAFDPEAVTHFLTEFDRFAGLLGEKRAVIACYPDVGVGYRLVAFASGGGKPVWEAPVWARHQWLARSGPEGLHRVELREHGGVIYLFGAGDGVYLEAFEAATGKCRFRFNTANWGHHSEMPDD